MKGPVPFEGPDPTGFLFGEERVRASDSPIDGLSSGDSSESWGEVCDVGMPPSFCSLV